MAELLYLLGSCACCLAGGLFWRLSDYAADAGCWWLWLAYGSAAILFLFLCVNCVFRYVLA